MAKIPRIAKRNTDTEHIMHAAARYGYHYAGVKNSHKLFSLLIGADFHHDKKRLKSSVDFLNYYECLDAAVNLGDTMAENFAEDDGKWYSKIVSKSKKPYLTVIGNHDMGNSDLVSISATRESAYKKFIRPTENRMGIETNGKSYYLKSFDRYKTALIVLNDYDSPDEADGDKYLVHRSTRVMSKEQVDWLCGTLYNIPEGYAVIIASHTVGFISEAVESEFTQTDPEESPPVTTVYGGESVLADIVNAWINGERLEKTYTPTQKYSELLPKISVSVDFSGRGKGDFVCYLAGHTHEDLILRCQKYPNQHAILFPSSSADTWQNYCSDLPRAEGTKAEDCLTVLSLDTKKREIRLIRIGSDFTMELKKRSHFVINY